MYDVVIVGAGPAGSSAATFTARAGLKTLVLDADQSITRRAWIPNHLGFPEGIGGPDLVDLGKKQAARAGAELVTAKVKEVQPAGDGFRIQTEAGEAYQGKQVILCLGANCELARQAGAEIVEHREPRFKEAIAVDADGQTRVAGLWAAGACAGTSVHTIITAGDGARVAINLISAVKGARHVDHEVMPAPAK